MNSAPGTARERHAVLLSRFIASRQWDRALGTAHDWLAEEPESPTAHRAAAQALINLGRHRLATPHLQKVLAANPEDDFAWRLASIADFHQRRPRQAHASIQRALRLQPRDAWHWFHLATIQYAYGGWREAQRVAQRALALAPHEAAIHNLLAHCERRGSPQRLTRFYDALRLDPGDAVVHHNVGEHLLGQKDYARAAEAFRQVLALEPTHRAAQENLLVALRELDPLRRALRWPDRLYDQYQGLSDRSGLGAALFAVLVLTWFTLIFLAFYLPCALFFLPLASGYEFLLARDLRMQVGVAGSRRGGWLGFWRWPRWVRLGALFFVYLVA